LIDSDLQNVQKALSKIKDEYREVIALHFLEELSIKEIAQILDKKPATVRVLLHRAMKALRKKLAKTLPRS